MVRTFEERDGKPFAIEGGPVNLGIAVDVERKDGSHSLMVPAIKGADGLDFAGFHSYYEELIAKTRENKLTADDFQGTNISPHQSRRDRHGRLGAAPARPARARSSPPARSPTRRSGSTPRRNGSSSSASRR